MPPSWISNETCTIVAPSSLFGRMEMSVSQITAIVAERRAWQILTAAFSLFLLICGVAAYGLYWFVFQSTIPLTATLYVPRGTVQLTSPNTQTPLAITDTRSNLEPGTIIQTDATSQAMITFYEPQTNLPVGSIVLYRDSQIELNSLSSPRFNTNQVADTIGLSGDSGRGHILVLHGLSHQVIFEFNTAQASLAISSPGLVLFEISDQRTQFDILDGGVGIRSRSSGPTSTFKKGSSTTIYQGSSAVTTLAESTGLIVNSDFSRPYTVGWKAYDNSEPVGSVYNSRLDGQDVVVIDRSQAKWPSLTLNHGETGLVQELDADVGQASWLELRVSLYVDEQNLSTCGVFGSECPLMIRVNYVNPGGAARTYIHGFYSNQDANSGYPLLCDTCRTEHDRINPRTWFTYSENLLALIPPDQRPEKITGFSIYASGHAYKVYVSDANLIVIKQINSRQ